LAAVRRLASEFGRALACGGDGGKDVVELVGRGFAHRDERVDPVVGEGLGQLVRRERDLAGALARIVMGEQHIHQPRIGLGARTGNQHADAAAPEIGDLCNS
jgi:hypothetical protein